MPRLNTEPFAFLSKFTPRNAATVATSAGRAPIIWLKDRNEVHGESLGQIGSLEVRLCRSAADVKRAQKLRYKVFYKEMAAIADARTYFTKRDIDAFDSVCDHLLVVDHDAPRKKPWKGPKVVGTYRLLGQTAGRADGGFYTAGEYEIEKLIARHPGLRFLELGRSCVLPPYRNKRTVELLWHGIWAYVVKNRFDVMVGCASFPGTDANAHRLALSFLHHYAPAPVEWQVSAHAAIRAPFDLLPKEAVDPKHAMRELPPLMKGYLRLGAMFGHDVVVDRQFGTTDVMVILPVSAISERYIGHFGADAGRYAA
ncbi:GNAT family N-acetyltransferase [Flaviflagellibacter deserti]|uniref:L-ornithine N(alpha)-acyltransferase n=1 Tax=Flaviflagellibacter deserti TaxID=2267266 RepID=A0ABV9Z0E1_9HYPH